MKLDNAPRPPFFRLSQSQDGLWFFVLVSRNGRVLMQSETYSTRDNALRAIDSAKNACAEAIDKEVAIAEPAPR